MEFAWYQAEVESALRRAQRLAPFSQDRIRLALLVRRDRDKAMTMLVATEAEHIGVPLLDTLADADRDLSTEQVVELVRMVDNGLASPD